MRSTPLNVHIYRVDLFGCPAFGPYLESEYRARTHVALGKRPVKKCLSRVPDLPRDPLFSLKSDTFVVWVVAKVSFSENDAPVKYLLLATSGTAGQKKGGAPLTVRAYSEREKS